MTTPNTPYEQRIRKKKFMAKFDENKDMQLDKDELRNAIDEKIVKMMRRPSM